MTQSIYSRLRSWGWAAFDWLLQSLYHLCGIAHLLAVMLLTLSWVAYRALADACSRAFDRAIKLGREIHTLFTSAALTVVHYTHSSWIGMTRVAERAAKRSGGAALYLYRLFLYLFQFGFAIFRHFCVQASDSAKCPGCGIRHPHKMAWDMANSLLVHKCARCGAEWAEPPILAAATWTAEIPKPVDVHETDVVDMNRDHLTGTPLSGPFAGRWVGEMARDKSGDRGDRGRRPTTRMEA